ncbi:MAG: alpha/beta fold hydrolase [Actinomycetota bacterium]|nr:alpha/beta fold hydrolase [Actinomycetota bacterium]
MRIDVNGTGIEVEDQGSGPPVLLIHGWPDTHDMWRHQVAALTAAGYRTIAPDLRGFGASDKPEGVEHYSIPFVVGDLLGVLDNLGVEKAHVVGHDWGAAIAWATAALVPDRVETLTALSVGHPSAFVGAGMPQREKSWYMLLFQFEGIAEQWLTMNDWANFAQWSRHPGIDDVKRRHPTPESMTPGLNYYRANIPPATLVGPPLEFPPIAAPTMGIIGTNDFALTESQMHDSQKFVSGPWRYERLEGVDHWMTIEAPDQVNALLLDFLAAN